MTLMVLQYFNISCKMRWLGKWRLTNGQKKAITIHIKYMNISLLSQISPCYIFAFCTTWCHIFTICMAFSFPPNGFLRLLKSNSYRYWLTTKSPLCAMQYAKPDMTWDVPKAMCSHKGTISGKGQKGGLDLLCI